MTKVDNFQIGDIDGCEFIKYKGLGSALISYERDEIGYMTGNIFCVFPDASHDSFTFDEAQDFINSDKWIVLR